MTAPATVAAPTIRRVRIDELPEALVHDIWFRREYEHRHLETVTGEPVLVLDTGRPNTDAGPDFLDARIRIDRTEWVGDVEIHRTSSEWLQHRHDADPRYNTVILHVVLVADLWTGGLYRSDGTRLEETVLSGFLRRPLRQLLVRMYQSGPLGFPCEESWHAIPPSVKQDFVAEMAARRLARRAECLATELKSSDSPEQLLYEKIMAALGYARNEEPMVQLARRTPLWELKRLADPADVEALMIGSAGLIPEAGGVEGSDGDRHYVDDLRDRFHRQRGGADRPPMRRQQWRFFRLRPSNFPPVRIAQAAAIVSHGLLAHLDPVSRLLSMVRREPDPLSSLRRCLAVETPDFWLSHVRLERPLRGGPTSLGRSRVDHIILNAILPLVEHEAVRRSDVAARAAVQTILRQLPPEDDEITRRYGGLAIELASAVPTQGLHELHGQLCTSMGCLRCRIGRFILSPETTPPLH